MNYKHTYLANRMAIRETTMTITRAPTTAPIMMGWVLSETVSPWLPGVVLSGKKSKND